MVRHNNQVPNAHFHKKWQFYVRTWFNQPARKLRRRKGKGFQFVTSLPGRLSMCSMDFFSLHGNPCGPELSYICDKHMLSSVMKTAARAEKAKAVFPRPAAGVLKPVVRGETIKYNRKLRLGKGFTLEELKVGPVQVPVGRVPS
jgi:large subunit ribosomal protein L13e